MYHQCRIILWFLKLHSIILCQSFAKSAIKTTYLSKRIFFFYRQQTCYFPDLKPYGLSQTFLCSTNLLVILRLILCSVNACESHLYPSVILCQKRGTAVSTNISFTLGFWVVLSDYIFHRFYFYWFFSFMSVCLVFSLLWWTHWNVIVMSEVTRLLTWFKVDFLKIGQMIPF